MIKQIINKITRDEYGRPSGIIAVDKPVGKSSHDMVDMVRKELGTRKVGHAGALDTFASGLLLILIGKDTKKADSLLAANKSYQARILLGMSTDTQDTEGVVIKQVDDTEVAEADCQTVLQKFVGVQDQFVSVYSSVKVSGNKLRVLMRDNRYNSRIDYFDEKKVIKFSPKEENPNLHEFEVEVPRKKINISGIELMKVELLKKSEIARYFPKSEQLPKIATLMDIVVHCSKGTYIRQLAEDIGASLGLPAVLVELRRTQISDVVIADAVDIHKLSN
ncbi:hypothetical protein H3C67_01495 [Candidatus Dojkabacteria bacterium]|uniref:tRNA pseudouridine synthase B n=2 Tax=Candidatus Dojkabacteria TaxID=74243 RepID=A0A136KE10_9BACT|nr:MAG: tRNA pseudouridine synthase B [candidate division WS6 bacterium OLB21]MBW7953438.1 hypothetical protein [Candidatus Dojkabacteria bacterium]